jgi:hypothetical protein
MSASAANVPHRPERGKLYQKISQSFPLTFQKNMRYYSPVHSKKALSGDTAATTRHRGKPEKGRKAK